MLTPASPYRVNYFLAESQIYDMNDERYAVI